MYFIFYVLSAKSTKIKPRTGEDIYRQPTHSGRIANLFGKKSNTDSRAYTDCKIGRNNKLTHVARYFCARANISNTDFK